MSFKEIFERYRNNTATNEERAMIDEEIEKHRLITEYLDEDWDIPVAPIDDTPLKDMKKVRKNIRKRNILIVLTSIVLCMAIFLTSWLVIIPAIEKQYWNPNANTAGFAYSTDLKAMLSAYSELTCYKTNIEDISVTKTGFATYDLTIHHWNQSSSNSLFAKATLEKGELILPDGLLSGVPINIFTRASYPFYNENLIFPDRVELSRIPQYITITAAVSFKHDMTMEDLINFNNSLANGHVTWVGIRNSPMNIQRVPLCGFKMTKSGAILDKENSAYPYLDLPYNVTDPQILENHFTSMLQFLDDQYNSGTGIKLRGNESSNSSYYKEVLDYIKANGVYTYGCYITGTPNTFFQLLGHEAVEQIWIQDSWLTVN